MRGKPNADGTPGQTMTIEFDRNQMNEIWKMMGEAKETYEACDFLDSQC